MKTLILIGASKSLNYPQKKKENPYTYRTLKILKLPSKKDNPYTYRTLKILKLPSKKRKPLYL